MKAYVIGAGVTGLSFAKTYQGNVEILEAGSSLGGKALSYKTETEFGIFGFDLGGHWFHHKSAPGALRLLEGLELEEHERKAYVHLDGQLLDYPIQQSYIRHQDSRFVEQVRLELQAIQPSAAYDNYEHMLLESYGPALYQAFFKNYNCKMYGVHDLAQMGAGRLETVRNVRTHQNPAGYNSDFLYPRAGLGAQAIPQFLARDLNIRYRSMVQSINLNRRTMTVNRRTVPWDTLISTMPLTALLGMITDVHPYMRELAGTLKASRGMILNLGVKKTVLHGDKTWIYYPDLRLKFYRTGFYSNIDSALAPPGYSSMYVECSPLFFENRQEAMSLIPQVIQQLIDTGLIRESRDVVTSRALYLNRNYCLPDMPRTELIRQYLENAGIYSIGRYGTWHWSSQHEDMQQAVDLADMLNYRYKDSLRDSGWIAGLSNA